MSHADTIVAVSSPPGRSPRGLIRISGDATRDILASLTDASTADRRLIRCRLLDGRLPALLACFAGPRSYTGEDLAELQVPGHPALLDRLLHGAIAAGARLAEPGEFTFRAYLAGKLDLTQAEGVAATIAAVSDGQLQAASLLREGRLGRWAADLVEELGVALALVEAGIDFTDQDDVVPVTPAQLDARLTDLMATLDALLDHSRSWSVIEALPRVVLVGAPSAGKSTLFNALLGHERAVISESPGTTRDLLAEPLRLCGADGREVEVMLIDIAGLDDPSGLIDEQMQAAAQQAIRTADLILSVADDEAAFVAAEALPKGVPVLRVRTKCDLYGSDSDVGALCISAKTGLHLDELARRIIARLGERAVSVAGDMLALQPRHERALRETKADLAAARALLESQRSDHALAHIELIAGAMRSGLDHLAALGGVMTPDDVIGRVFATFCIGK